jgi:hypothetical protein
MKRSTLLLALALVCLCSAVATAGFSGQIILGPLGPGSAVAGDTTGASDDNDGWTSGGTSFSCGMVRMTSGSSTGMAATSSSR